MEQLSDMTGMTFLISEVGEAGLEDCHRGLKSDLTKGGGGWSGDEPQMTNVHCKMVTEANKSAVHPDRHETVQTEGPHP